MLPTTLVMQLLLLVAPSIVIAQSSCSTSRTQTCSTTMANVPPGFPVFPRTSTTTRPAVTVTTTPTVTRITTVAAVPVTATVQSTSIVTVVSTASPGTQTLLLTSTVFSTTAQSTTTVLTGTATLTTVSSLTQVQTVTVPTASGFIDAYDSSSDSTPAARKRSVGRRTTARNDNQKRTLLDSLMAMMNGGTVNTKSTPSSAAKPKSYAVRDFSNPVAINCVVIVVSTCTRAASASTITSTSTLPASTTTRTIVSTITSTSVSIPPSITTTIYAATTTSVVTQLTTLVSSATVTTTSTSTFTITTTTSSYAACATNNILGPQLASAPGGLLNRVLFYDSSAKVVQSSEVSAYDCCVVCQNSQYCQFFQYGAANGECFVVGQDANWCPSSQQDNLPAYYTWDDADKVSDPKVVGNGGCGTVMSAGQDNGSSSS